MMGFGVLIARLRLEAQGQALSPRLIHAADLGLLFAGSGVAVVLLSIWRYAAVRRMLREGRFEAALYGPLLFAGAVALLGILILLYLLERPTRGLP